MEINELKIKIRSLTHVWPKVYITANSNALIKGRLNG